MKPKNPNLHKISNRFQKNYKDTSWQNVSGWYNDLVGDKGQYFHKKIIIPSVARILEVSKSDKVLDLGCGQGILERNIPVDTKYIGVDLSFGLISQARKLATSKNHRFEVRDITKDLSIPDTDFSIATIILALQNVQDHSKVFENVSKHLKTGGRFLIVLNHPYFRIPKKTSWGIDKESNTQYRRVDEYMTSSKLGIDMTPGGNKPTMTWSFHEPLQNYIKALKKHGFVLENMEEWISDKQSEDGPAANMENKARKEIPMFMCLIASKLA